MGFRILWDWGLIVGLELYYGIEKLLWDWEKVPKKGFLSAFWPKYDQNQLKTPAQSHNRPNPKICILWDSQVIVGFPELLWDSVFIVGFYTLLWDPILREGGGGYLLFERNKSTHRSRSILWRFFYYFLETPLTASNKKNKKGDGWRFQPPSTPP